MRVRRHYKQVFSVILLKHIPGTHMSKAKRLRRYTNELSAYTYIKAKGLEIYNYDWRYWSWRDLEETLIYCKE